MGAMYPHMFLILLLVHGANADTKAPARKWQTLSGEAPLVIARGGFSGVFPESSIYGYQFALSSSLPDVVLFCDLQLSKDAVGICKTGLALDNSTQIAEVFPRKDKTYNVNGEPVHGWFSVDFSGDQLLQNVTLTQNVFSRPSIFDGSMQMAMVDDVVSLRPPLLWVNVQYNMFFQEHRQDMTEFIELASKDFTIDYISSPEVQFLKGLKQKLRGRTKLIFRFLDEQLIEPSTNQTYGSLLKDLSSIKSFASGILVPKNYIWPVNTNQYLDPATTLVTDAHDLGLEVYAAGFANDFPASYNYSFEPTAEYLQFIDNSKFSVDGVLTDFSPTASEAIACLAHTKGDAMPTLDSRPLIISHNGASGVFAGSTDLAYEQAVKDSIDIIDCSVQMSKDGVAFCMGSADLMADTTAAQAFLSRSSSVPEIQQNSGIFSFDLTWSEIQSLKPELKSPFSDADMERNPAVKNDGKFLTLAEFLNFAKNSTVSGILINIENAPYLASKKSLGIVDAVSGALVNASYDKQTKQRVLIQSDDSAVLSAFKKFPNYERVLNIEDTISDASKPSLDEIKQFADAVTITRNSIAQGDGYFLSRFTDIVERMHHANLSVYVGVLRNEFLNLAFDYFADPLVEIATYASSANVDGIVTEFPATASTYFRSPCSNLDANLTFTILPTRPGALLNLATPGAQPPAVAPAPVLEVSDVLDPPLPPILANTPPAPAPAPRNSGQPAEFANVSLCLLMTGLAFIFLSYHSS